jgi:hypothetical protein
MMFTWLLPSLPKPVARRRSMRTSKGIEALESRLLLTADLTVTSFSYDFLPSATQPNVYHSNLSVTIKNLGTTTVSLTGNNFDVSDNVNIETGFSVDNVLGNIDDIYTGYVVISGPESDNVNISLAPNEQKTFFVTGQVTAYVGFPANYLIARVDASGAITETDETNNSMPLSFGGIFPPSFAGGSNTQIPAGVPELVSPTLHFFALTTTDFDGARLNVTNSTSSRGDRLSFRSATVNSELLKRSGKKIKLGDTVVGSIQGGKKDDPLAMTFNENSNNLVINTVVKNVTLRAKPSKTGPRQLTYNLIVANTSSFWPQTVTVV